MALIKNFTYTLAANQRLPIERAGSFIRCTSAQAAFTIQPGDNGEPVELQAGIGVSYESGFRNFIIVNGATPQTVALYIGDGSVQDSRFYGSINALITPGSSGTNTADAVIAAAATVNIALNLSRRAITVGVLSTSTGSLRAGYQAGVGKGAEIQPGTTYRWESTAALQIYNDTAANQTYWVQEDA